eukprot:TRINITY_DN39393_c0_g1_i1.p1 TRINITY_DN39393_c0_g1~~TRINITY_DN39393_c0_g1_i1.p1  ORF type:complete len:345 (+),score=44.71 TRINITY_DN39393_c0_g1_i1:98-1036(+)
MAAVLIYVGKGDTDVEHYGDEGDEQVRKQVNQKLKMRKKALEGGDESRSSTSDGLPRGQVRVKKWIVLDLGKRPKHTEYDLSDGAKSWSLQLSVNGSKAACDQVVLSFEDVVSLGVTEFSNCDWHCVTGWTASNLNFTGVALRTVLAHVEERIRAQGGKWINDWRYILQSSPDGYSVPVFREDAIRDDDQDAFLALCYENELIPMEHGGPRLVFPGLFGWKSCKWLSKIDVSVTYEKGFWERIGCHARGRVEFNERWAPQASSVWNVLSTQNKLFAAVFGERIWTLVMQTSGPFLGYWVDTIKYHLRLSNKD